MKKIVKKTLGLLLSASFVFGAALPFTACDLTQQGTTAQANVSVIGGTGGGTYRSGDDCTVTATVPEGSKFVEWTVFGVPVSQDSTYTFKVDFDIELTAVFEEEARTEYTVTVNGGTIGDTDESVAQLAEGSKVRVYAAESQARKFVKWQIGGEEFSQNPYELTVTGNCEITAVFDEFCMVSVSGGTVEGNRSAIVPEGSDVTVVANKPAEGQGFVYWYTLDENFKEVKLSEEEIYSFKLEKSIKVYAKYKYLFLVEAVRGTIKETGENTSYVYDGESVVLVPDGAPSADKTFIGWYKNGEKISISREYKVTVSGDVQMEARYGEVRSVSLATPDSSGNENHVTDGIIYREPGGAVAFDRLSADNIVTMFVGGIEYAAYKIYTSRTADKETEAIGELHVVLNPDSSPNNTDTAWLTSADGKKSMQLMGSLGNLYFDAVNYGQFQELMRYALGYRYCSGQTYYFAAQLKAPDAPYLTMEDDFAIRYTDSEISKIGSWGYCETPGAPVGEYTVKVQNGFIEGDLTQVTAGYGAQITAVATAPEDESIDWVFLGWKEVTVSGGEEALGATLSSEQSYTFGASKDVTIRAVFADRSEITQIPLPMPNNSENKIIYEEGAKGSSALALDRNNFVDPESASSESSMFNANVAYAVFYVYETSDADKNDYIASFRMYVDLNKDAQGGRAFVGWFTKADGSEKCEIVRGSVNNYYVDSSNRGDFRTFMRSALGDRFDENRDYFFAAQVIAGSEEYISSEISAIGTNGIRI